MSFYDGSIRETGVWGFAGLSCPYTPRNEWPLMNCPPSNLNCVSAHLKLLKSSLSFGSGVDRAEAELPFVPR